MRSQCLAVAAHSRLQAPVAVCAYIAKWFIHCRVSSQEEFLLDESIVSVSIEELANGKFVHIMD